MIARQRRLVIGIALLTATLAGATGCAAGQVTQTSEQQSAVNGASGQSGPIAVRDAVFVYPSDGEHHHSPGSSVSLTLTIVNTGGTPDRLAMVQSPVAAMVRLDGATTIPGHSAVRAIVTEVEEPTATVQTTTPAAPTTTSGPTTTPDPTGSTTTAPPGTTTPTTTAAPTTTADPEPGGADLEPGQLTILLEDITEDIRPGRTVRVVLLFEQAGEIVLQVPVASPDEPRGESAH